MRYNKFGNKKVVYDGYKFDSIREKNRYIELKLLEKAEDIKDLYLQVKYELQPSFDFHGKKRRSISYIADFVYYDCKNKKTVIEDVKGFRTDTYKLKKKMFEYKYNIEITEI